ncbi:hypothetical protein BV22DRAFT_999234 [Leucogyrophana mollusca]|uniref:Uncharacterized protein n=1 Tax=Leucogyrophana mollusca TaxID=85980 RepID=A0ACB8C1E6_9AGAM|nr:hypothetical protein BV22DRAFT_999234 [Leucogyrophana mollusca]
MANAKQYYVNATSYAATYQKLAAQSKSTTSNDPQHQRETAAALSGFSYNILGFQTALAELGADEGLANYDRTNDLETLLKNVVNVNKGVLTTTSVLVDDIPVLGPILGPTVYDIKCVLDEILDTCENLTDATINALQPLLKTVIGQATTAACHSGVEVAGLCI